jgi:hypothetical protein
MHMGSASGEVISLILLIAISDMKEDDFVVIEVPGLNQYGNSELVVGYVTFCQTRAGNANFFNWFMTQVAIPKVCRVREAFGLKVMNIFVCFQRLHPYLGRAR